MNTTRSTNRSDMSQDVLTSRLRALGDADPGADFADRVMARLPLHAPRTAPQSRIARLACWFVRPRAIRMSPLGGLAMAACVLLVMGLTLRGGMVKNGEAPQGLSPVKFVLAAPGAREVAVIGSFNRWNAAGWTMRNDAATGLWTLSAALPPGSHEYVFLVDGTTPVPDAAAAFSADDGFGSRNSVLLVKSSDASLL